MEPKIIFPTSVMSVEDILDFVAEYYGADTSRRSLNPVNDESGNVARCLYNGPHGEMCAFRMFVRDDQAHSLREGSSACNLYEARKMRPEVADLMTYQMFTTTQFGEQVFSVSNFWSQVQQLHDTDCFWTAGSERLRADRVSKEKLKWSKYQRSKKERWASRGVLEIEISQDHDRDAAGSFDFKSAEGGSVQEYGIVAETMREACAALVQSLRSYTLPYPSVKELMDCVEEENGYTYLNWSSATHT